MPLNNKSKRNINNLLNNSILIVKMVMLKNSNNLIKPIKHSVILKKEDFMINMDLKDLSLEEVMTFSICSSEEVEEEEQEVVLEDENKLLKLNQLKKHSQSLYKTFIMAKLLKCKIQEQDAVKNVTVKVGKMYKNVKHVKEKVLLFKCIKWVLECINKFKNIVINAKVKDKLLLKEVNVKVVMAQRF